MGGKQTCAPLLDGMAIPLHLCPSKREVGMNSDHVKTKGAPEAPLRVG